MGEPTPESPRDSLERAVARLMAADLERAEAVADVRAQAKAMHGRVAIRETASRAGLSAASVSTFFAGHLALSSENAARVVREMVERDDSPAPTPADPIPSATPADRAAAAISTYIVSVALRMAHGPLGAVPDMEIADYDAMRKALAVFAAPPAAVSR